jgi:hypothetical protein
MCGAIIDETLPTMSDSIRSLLYDRKDRNLDYVHQCNEEGDLGVCELLGGRWDVETGE